MKTVITENDTYKLTLTKNECVAPKGVYHVQMTQEQIDSYGKTSTSTYQFFLDNDDLMKLSQELLK